MPTRSNRAVAMVAGERPGAAKKPTAQNVGQQRQEKIAGHGQQVRTCGTAAGKVGPDPGRPGGALRPRFAAASQLLIMSKRKGKTELDSTYESTDESEQDALLSGEGEPVDALCMAAHSKNCDFKPLAIKRRPVGPHDVLIDMKYCGVCHSDLHSVAGHMDGLKKIQYPHVPGHELAGVVAAVGAAVTKVSVPFLLPSSSLNLSVCPQY